MTSLVIQETRGAVAVITLNRPEAMNALSQALQRELTEAVKAAAADPSVRVLVVTGAGERAFSAGLDLKEVGRSGLGGTSGGEGDPIAALNRCRKPIIAAVNGVAITGGFELALACDILLASSKARFADTHARVGVIPGWGLSQRLSRLIGISRAKELSFSGNYLDASTAMSWGLVNRVVDPAELMPAALQLGADIASCDPSMIERYKALIDEGFGLPFTDALALEARRSREDNAQVTAASIADRRADVQARGRTQAG